MAVKKIDKATQNSVAILAAHGASNNKICKQTGLHHSSVKAILNEPTVIATRQEIESELASMFADTAKRAIQKISDEKLEKSSARDLGILAGVCTDKHQILSGRTASGNSIMLMAVLNSFETAPCYELEESTPCE